jgi:drug/metabolite transporter (DMT)-like permease
MTTSSAWRVGLPLALATALLWASLPVALKLALESLDVWTLTWFRFLVAFVVTLLWLVWRRGLVGFGNLDGSGRWLLFGAGLGLLGNYVFYLLGLKFTTPANAQLLIQLAPLLLALGSVLVFKERVSAGQLIGFALIVIGLIGFGGEQAQALAAPPHYRFGALCIVIAAATWAAYGLAQRELFRTLSSQQILLFIYAFASVILLPSATPSMLSSLDLQHALAVLYCCFNTVAAYACFAEAQARWESARVGAVLAMTPILTIAFASLAHHRWPASIAAERIGWIGIISACLIVSGSMWASLSRGKEK